MNERFHDQPSARPEYIDSGVEWSYDTMTPEKIAELEQATITRINEAIDAMLEKRDISFSGTLGVLHEIDDFYDRTEWTIEAMSYLHPDKATRDAATDTEISLAAFKTDKNFREDIYELVKAYSETDDAANLEGEEARLLEKTMRDYRRRGFELNPEFRQLLAEMQKQLDEKTAKFSQNIRDDNTQLTLTLDQLAGVPASTLERMEQTPDGNYIMKAASPEALSILTHASNRDVRREIIVTRTTRLLDKNVPIIDEVTSLRRDMATLLGYESWAHFKLEERMAKTPETVQSFYNQIIPGITDQSKKEARAMEQLLHADGYDDVLQSYDLAYYENKQREQDFHIDEEKIAEYFPLETVLEGLFEINGSMFGVNFVENKSAATWHKDVRAYTIFDTASGNKIGDIFLDLHPREGKYKHAAAQGLVLGRELPDGSYRTSAAQMMTNFPSPTETKPSLLTHDDVETLFHEFGHILDGTLSKARYSTFSGTRTERDFVEAPSQINENWAWDKAVLRRISQHYQTGAPLPDDMIDNMIAARDHNIAMFTGGQISYGLYDMTLHGPNAQMSLSDIWKAANAHRPIPRIEGTFMPATFDHLMGGYDAGYYSYLWSDSIGQDLFTPFLEAGILNPEVGMRWRKEIYETGGTKDAIELIRNFLEREPNNKAFLRRLGITALES